LKKNKNYILKLDIDKYNFILLQNNILLTY
jgi:hypothetical protein